MHCRMRHEILETTNCKELSCYTVLGNKDGKLGLPKMSYYLKFYFSSMRNVS